jgi:anti-sigma factor RsiW
MIEPRRRTCLELADRLSEYIDEELPPELEDRVHRHFDQCADCERFLESVRRVKDLGRWLPRPELDPQRLRSIAERLREKLDEEDRRRPRNDP